MSHSQNKKKIKTYRNHYCVKKLYLIGGALQQQQQTTNVSSIGPDELPPPYQSNEDRGLPMVTCRVCSAMIDISWKREQHVVKCNQCNEATVRKFDSLQVNP
jgi:hypothetical protein